MNNIEKNVERELVADAALNIQKIIMEHHLNLNLKFGELSILLCELIQEIYELNPCSELLCQWRLRLLENKTSGGSL